MVFKKDSFIFENVLIQPYEILYKQEVCLAQN